VAAPEPLAGRLRTVVIERHAAAGRALLRPRGELVHGCATPLAEALAALPDDTHRIELDMSGVTFMDTAGLQFLDLLHDHARRHGVSVRTAHWNDQPRRILELAGVDTAGSADTSPAPSAPASPVALERAEQLRVLQEEIEQLRHAIASRPVIDQARGILMATQSCTSEEAWTILREASQLSNTKLRTVAAALIAGARPDGPPPPENVRIALRTALARHGR
jgi:anti-anti-sigma factor